MATTFYDLHPGINDFLDHSLRRCSILRGTITAGRLACIFQSFRKETYMILIAWEANVKFFNDPAFSSIFNLSLIPPIKSGILHWDFHLVIQ